MREIVGVLGAGFVGGSLIQVLLERGVRVASWDPKQESFPDGAHDVPSFLKHNRPFLVFVCVPTPMSESGRCDTSIVDRVITEVGDAPGERIIVLKSTVPPGYTDGWNGTFARRGDDKIRVVFCPEFLREATALEDMRSQKRIVLGGPRPWVNEVKQFFERVFPDATIHKTSAANAELVKYVTNAFLAVKVSFANEVAQLAEALDAAGLNVDYDRVVDIACEDERLGRSHWKVPGPMPADDSGEPARGFGGSCFVKDLNALMCVARQRGVDPKVMAAAWAKNLEVRPGRDWERLAGRAVSAERDPGPGRE